MSGVVEPDTSKPQNGVSAKDINSASEIDSLNENTDSDAILLDHSPLRIVSPNKSAELTFEGKTSEQWKEEGNRLFSSNHYEKALECYNKAIDLNPNVPSYYGNRSFCQLKLEAYGAAIADAERALSLDSMFIKGYYRRGAAHLALGRYKEAHKDFLQVCKIKPQDKDAKSKLQVCDKAIRSEAFLKAIEGEASKPPSETVDLNSEAFQVPESYTGPMFETKPDQKFVDELIEWYRSQKQLHKRYIYSILLQIIDLLKKSPSLVDINIPENGKFTVCGDVHGQFYDVLNIFKLNGMPSESNPYLFNGDFVDRGSFSVEVITLFLALKLVYPNHFHMTRGNHESITMNSIYGFQGEVNAKIEASCFPLFTEAFNYMPIAYCIQSKVLVLHGGLFSRDGVTLDDIRKIDRIQQPPESGLMCEALWSDPTPFRGRHPSNRGVGLSFGPDVTERFCVDNNLKCIIRSHEVKEGGYEIQHDGKCITIFSAPNYCDQMGNKGAFITMGPDCELKFTQFEAVEHPPARAMQFARPFCGML